MGGCVGPETVIVSGLREYFTLGGCCSPEIVIVVCSREYFSLAECVSPAMSNAVTAVIVTCLNLDLATWLGGRGVSY